jgi:hypothetical protein
VLLLSKKYNSELIVKLKINRFIAFVVLVIFKNFIFQPLPVMKPDSVRLLFSIVSQWALYPVNYLRIMK